MEENLEIRKELEPYFEEIQGPSEQVIKPFSVKMENGESYIGYEFLYQTAKVTVYFHIENEDEVLMFLYIGLDVFDKFVDHLDYYNIPGIRNAYPLLMESLDNGNYGNYRHCALVKMRNKKYNGNFFWCFVTRLENISAIDFDNPYILRKYLRLYNRTRSVFGELLSNKVSNWDKFKMFASAFYDGYKWGNIWTSPYTKVTEISEAINEYMTSE